MKKIILVRRYSGKVDQDFMDLEFARMDQEKEMEKYYLKKWNKLLSLHES